MATVKRQIRQLRSGIKDHEVDPSSSLWTVEFYDKNIKQLAALRGSIKPKKSLDQLLQSAKDRRNILVGSFEGTVAELEELRERIAIVEANNIQFSADAFWVLHGPNFC